MVYENVYIPLIVKNNVILTADSRSIVFERPIGFNFEAGDWIDILFDNIHLRGGRTYSLSSSPTEPDLVITFKDGISEIKKILASLTPGDKATIVQYGNDYKFTLKPNRQSVLIAGGIGVAPFRSMLKQIYDTDSVGQATLIYMNKDSRFLFEEEIKQWIAELPQSKLHFIITEGLKKKDRFKLLMEAVGDKNSSFYIAGPEGMVESTEHLLLENGVDLKDIKIDSFGGY